MNILWRHQAGALALCTTLLSGCATRQQLVPMLGITPDLLGLTGEWAGTYTADEQGGRNGSIVFTLNAKADTARGDVLMTQQVQAAARPDWAQPAPPYSRLLAISFVYVASQTVRGALDEYEDPVCGCRLRTTFTGRVEGDVISGTYVSRHAESGALTRGKWRVTRRVK